MNGARLKTMRAFTDSALKVVIFLPYLQMSKNLRRDFARGERWILGSRTAKIVSDGSSEPLEAGQFKKSVW